MNGKRAAYRGNIIVFVLLAVLSALEYFVAVSLQGSAVLLILIALIKASLIVYYFMHIYRLWREEGH